MAHKMWFGRPGAFRWVPVPMTGMEVSHDGYAEVVEFQNGRAAVVRSKATHKVFNMDFPVQDASGADGLDIFRSYASGLYGDAPFYLADPMNYETNLFPENWAAPMLIAKGWKKIYSTTPTFAATAANVYGHPAQGAVFEVTTTASATPVATQRVVIPVPPDRVLHLGYKGSVTGTAEMRARGINPDGTYAASVVLTALGVTTATLTNATFAGSTYEAVEVYITRSSSAASTITVNSMTARLAKSGASAFSGRFVEGQGSTGLDFGNSAIPETYVMTDGRKKGLSTSLVEID